MLTSQKEGADELQRSPRRSFVQMALMTLLVLGALVVVTRTRKQDVDKNIAHVAVETKSWDLMEKGAPAARLADAVVTKSDATQAFGGSTYTVGVQTNPTFSWLKSRIESKGCRGLAVLGTSHYHFYWTDLACTVSATTITVESQASGPNWTPWGTYPAGTTLTISSDSTCVWTFKQIDFSGNVIPGGLRSGGEPLCWLNGHGTQPVPPHGKDLGVVRFSEEQADWVPNLKFRQINGVGVPIIQDYTHVLYGIIGTIPSIAIKSAVSGKMIMFDLNRAMWSNTQTLLISAQYKLRTGESVILTASANKPNSLFACSVVYFPVTGTPTNTHFGMGVEILPSHIFSGAKCTSSEVFFVA